jgi:hypothetical protein
MTARRPTRADLALVGADTGNQQCGESRACRGIPAPQISGLSQQRRDQLWPGQQRQDKAVAAEGFPETASTFE